MSIDLSPHLRDGDRIVWGQACGEPTTLIEALIAQAGGIGRVSAFAAGSFGSTYMGGTGGQVDFVAPAPDRQLAAPLSPCPPPPRAASSAASPRFCPAR